MKLTEKQIEEIAEERDFGMSRLKILMIKGTVAFQPMLKGNGP